MSEIRYDKIHNQYVIIAVERLHRPNISTTKTPKNSKKECPFCEGNESLTPPEIFAIRENEANKKGWKTRVIPNLYKALQIEEQNLSQRDGFFEYLKGFGAHEIIIDSPCHKKDFASFKKNEILNWLKTINVRISDLKNDKRLIEIVVFKNSGKNAGATQPHPHTQIIALPMMSKNSIDFLERNSKYYEIHGRGIIEDVAHNEKIASKRVIEQTDNFIAYCPYASSFSFEVIIAPLKVIPSTNRCSKEELIELSSILQSVFKMLKRQLDRFDYNITFHIAPLNEHFENEKYIKDIDKNFSFYIRIMPRIYMIAGFELSTHMSINSIEPEFCAKLLLKA